MENISGKVNFVFCSRVSSLTPSLFRSKPPFGQSCFKWVNPFVHSKSIFYLFTYVHCCFACMHVCERVLDPLELELQTSVSCYVLNGNWTWVLWRATSTPDHWAISPAPFFVPFESLAAKSKGKGGFFFETMSWSPWRTEVQTWGSGMLTTTR